MQTLALKRNEGRRLRAGHLWIFSNEVDTEKSPLRQYQPGEQVIVLDERGKTISTAQLASQIESWMTEGRDVCFLIGGADGLDDTVKHDADMVLSLSNMTLPHALVRVVLAEQLYRAMSIIRNHPYHRQ